MSVVRQQAGINPHGRPGQLTKGPTGLRGWAGVRSALVEVGLLRGIVGVQPPAAPPGRLIRGLVHERGTDPDTLPRGGDAGVEQDRVRTAVADHVDEADQLPIDPCGHPEQAVPLQPLAPGDTGRVVPESRGVQVVELAIGEGTAYLKSRVRLGPQLHLDPGEAVEVLSGERAGLDRGTGEEAHSGTRPAGGGQLAQLVGGYAVLVALRPRAARPVVAPAMRTAPLRWTSPGAAARPAAGGRPAARRSGRPGWP